MLAIPEILNGDELQTSKRRPFSHHVVWFLRRRLGLRAVQRNGVLAARWEDGAYTVRSAAEAVGVYPGIIHRWLRNGRVHLP